MKIAFCAPWDLDRDGIADYSRELAEYLQTHVPLRIIRLSAHVGNRQFYGQLADRANHTDLCHAQHNFDYWNGTWPFCQRFTYFRRHLRVPLVLTVHEIATRFSAAPFLPLRYIFRNGKRLLYNLSLPIWAGLWSWRLNDLTFRSAHLLIVHHEYHRRWLRTLGITNPDIVVQPHGLPVISDEERTRDPCAARARWNLQARKVLAVFGFIGGRKGYETVLEALRLLPKDVHLLIAGGIRTEGSRDYLRGLEHRISAMGLADRVVITGYLPRAEISWAMAAADIVVAPLALPQSSGSVNWGLSYWKPVVASATETNQEINARVGCMVLFKTGDAIDLRDRVSDVLGDAERRIRLSGGAQEYWQEFNYARTAATTVQLYQRVLDE